VTARRGLGPAELAAALGLPMPTAEQAAVISALPGPAVVVAGAGSGKTETMSARVVWLVANGYVRPEQVLGLTFTNKAAAELGTRLRARLAALARHGLTSPFDDEPTVLTYHSYAARLVAEHALRLAVEPTARLLTEALCWQLAARVVRGFDGDLPHVDRAESTVIGYVLDLAGELAEHLVSGDRLAEWTEGFVARAEGLPPGPRYKEPGAKVREILDAARARCELLPLVARYEQAKRDTTAMDFGDQMSLAARIAERFDEVGRGERARYGVVLLDEYQDTGHSQLVLLRALFGGDGEGRGHPVTAVGDPCQSIYGWRGATAGNLARFPRHFAAVDGTHAPVLPLSTSFRNDRRILDAANVVSEPLRAQGVDVGVLTPGPAAGEGTVRAALLDTVDDEAAWLAAAVAEVWKEDTAQRAETERAGHHGRTIAVLCRRRSQFERVAAAIRGHGIPVELVGLGGLLATPEVRDVVSTLRVLSDPAAGDAAVRLLTGARWRIGPRDLAALGQRARELARKGARREHADPDRADDASLVEALDDPGDADRYTAEGHRRLEALRWELTALRRRVGQPLPELVAEAERVLRLDIELAAGPDRGAGRVHLDRFLDVSARFAEDAEVATLSAFLAYLEAAESTERGLEAGVVEVNADRVQVLTVHAAKGLEWDVVAVPGLVTGVLPDRDAVSRTGWAKDPAALPYPLRGDAADLPDFEPGASTDQAKLEYARRDFAEACRARGELEERRLAYVALTRARRLLLCSGYRWDDATKPREPSPFLTELSAHADVEVWVDEPAEDATNPLLAQVREVAWPVDPLGGRRTSVEAGASLVRTALAGTDEEPEDALFAPEEVAAAGWRRDADLLLAERDARGAAGSRLDVPLPGQLSVSALVTLARDPAELARQIRRPLPYRPAPLARRGTAFHAWLEERYAGERLLDLDELPGAADDGAAPDGDLEVLQERFLASEWADRVPVEVEVPFEAVLGGTGLAGHGTPAHGGPGQGGPGKGTRGGALVRGRMDAVFADPDGGYTVIDWKTGARPSGAAARAAAVQLAAYRLAWSDLAGAPLERVRAAFHYVREGATVRPVDLLDGPGLLALLENLPSS
jgi:DNA helicase-2/ATP-dependent DNA helicase PcrA